eukprot:403352809
MDSDQENEEDMESHDLDSSERTHQQNFSNSRVQGKNHQNQENYLAIHGRQRQKLQENSDEKLRDLEKVLGSAALNRSDGVSENSIIEKDQYHPSVRRLFSNTSNSEFDINEMNQRVQPPKESLNRKGTLELFADNYDDEVNRINTQRSKVNPSLGTDEDVNLLNSDQKPNTLGSGFDSEAERERLGSAESEEQKYQTNLRDHLVGKIKKSLNYYQNTGQLGSLPENTNEFIKTDQTFENLKSTIDFNKMKDITSAFQKTKTAKILEKLSEETNLKIPMISMTKNDVSQVSEGDAQINNFKNENEDLNAFDDFMQPNLQFDQNPDAIELDKSKGDKSKLGKIEEPVFDPAKHENEIKKLQKEALETDQDEDEGGRQEAWSNLFYLMTSFVFIIIFVTQFDLTAQQKQSQLLTTLFDNSVFEFQTQHKRQDAGSAAEIYQYLKDFMIPVIYDEMPKQSNGYMNNTRSLSNRYNKSLENNTQHYIGYYTYYVGMRFSLKRQKYTKNDDSHSSKVLPTVLPYNFKIDDFIEDFKEPIDHWTFFDKIDCDIHLYNWAFDLNNLAFANTLAQAFCLQSMYYWFVLYARKDQFNIPIEDMSEFNQQIDSCYYITQYLNSSSIAVVLLCIKNLRILMIFFPSFGVLFDTFRRAKQQLFYFFTMSLTFLVGFLFAGNSLFGSQLTDYRDVGTSMMSLFRMLVGEFKFRSLERANPELAIVFFIIFVVFFFIILLNLLLTIVCEVYDSLRQKKALDSMAKAKIISKENYEYLQKWLSLILCRMEENKDSFLDKNLDSNSSSSSDEEIQKKSSKVQISKNQKDHHNQGQVDEALAILKRQQILREQQNRQKNQRKKDMKTVCLHNKAKLFESGKMLKTKEFIENEMNLIKRQIISKKVKEREERIKRFQTFDIKGVVKLRSSIVYLIFIVNFVVMLSLQLQITESGQAMKSIKWKLNNQNFTNIQLYTPFDPENTLLQTVNGYDRQRSMLPNNTYSDIFLPSQLEDWLYQTLYFIIYNSTDQTILRHNHLFGDQYIRITLRKLKMRENKNEFTKQVISQYRKTELLEIGTGVDDDEITKDFYGSQSGRLYKYEKPKSIKSYNEDGGFVILLPKDKVKARQILYDVINDNLIDETLANLVIEFDNKFLTPIYATENPNLFEKLCVFLGINYFYIINKNFCILFLYVIYYSMKWLLRQVLRFFRVMYRYISSDFFRLFNLVSISISLTLIGTWFYIILDDDFHINSQGKIIFSNYNQIDLLSNLTTYYDTYNFYSSINTIIIFWRILQFFSFSYKLSAFTEILAASKNDVLFFMLMFIICLFGFAVMGFSIFGQNSQKYSNIFFTIIEQFKMMIEYFDYDSMYQSNPTFAAPFFVSFMLLFDQFMKNMFIAIIMAHYSEFQAFSGMKQIDHNEDDNLHRRDQSHNQTRLVGSGFNQITDINGETKTQKSGAIKWYVSKWDNLELFLFKAKIEDNDDDILNQHIQQLEHSLDNKYAKPEYDQENIHKFVQPFLFPELYQADKSGNSLSYRKEQNSALINLSQLPAENQGFDNRFELDPEEQKIQEIKSKRALKKEYDIKYGGENADNQVLMLNYINIIPKNFEGLTDDELTSSNVWVAALEKILFNQSQKNILFSDMHEPEDLLSKQQSDGTLKLVEQAPIYDIEQFNKSQTSYLMMSFEERVQEWKSSRPSKKNEFWIVMDFEKIFDDENKFREQYAERLETFLELINKMQKDFDVWEKQHLQQQIPETTKEKYRRQKAEQIAMKSSRQAKIDKLKKLVVATKEDLIKQVPVLTFKKINRSPELQDPNFSRASQMQKHLWINETSQDEKFLLWQDLALKVTNALNEIKYEFLSHLREELNQLEQENQDLDGTLHKKVYLQYKSKQQKLVKLISQIELKQKKLEDIAKKATYQIRSKHLDPVFFLESQEILQSKKYKQFKKVRADGHIKKLFDVIQQEHEQMKADEAKEKLKIFSKRRPISENMIVTQPTIVKNPTLGKKIGDERKSIELRISGKNEVIGSRSNSPSRKQSDQLVNRVSNQLSFGLLGKGNGPSPNKSIERFDESQFGSIVHLQGNHHRGISSLPLVKAQTASPNLKHEAYGAFSNRNLISQEDKLRVLTEVNNLMRSDTEREGALRLKSLTKHKNNIENTENYEIKKIQGRIYIETLKQYFGLMVHGVDGSRQTYLNSHFNLKNATTSLQKLKIQKQKYLFLTQTLDPHEERLALWLTMSEDDKLRMLACQHIEGEAETMAMLLIEEIEKMPSAFIRMQEIDRKLERSLDNQIYEKYRKLTEWQALKTTSLNSEKRLITWLKRVKIWTLDLAT